MEELSGLSLDELRQRAAKHGKYQRLTAEDCLELLELYFSYQRQVYLLVCKNRLQVNPALAHLGLLSRFWGPTNFNNYCKYNEVASVTYNDSKCLSLPNETTMYIYVDAIKSHFRVH
jgi:hypothetical protein